MKSAADIDAINEERTELLVCKYSDGGGLSDEEERRLEYLHRRIEELIPSVTEADWRMLRALRERLG